MNIDVTRTEVVVENGYIVNKGEYKINPCEFTFSEDYTADLVKKAVFDDGKTTKEMAIINNKCDIPYEVLNSDSFELRVYAYRVNGSELELVYSPTPATVYLREGSYRGVTGSGEIITPTQFEQYEQALNDGLQELEAGLEEVSNVDIDASKTGNKATVTITNREGTEKSVEIFDGEDYVLTPEDKQEIIDIVEAEVSLDIPTKVSELENDSEFIDKDVNNLTNYTSKSSTGSSIELSINSSTYVMTINLKNSAGTTISTGTIDLPLETMVVGATYDNTNKKIVLTLKNGSTIDVPVADLVSGLQSEINSNNKLSSDLVNDTNHTNKFVTASEKEQITTNATDISNIKDGTSIDSFGDVETAFSGKEDKSNKVTTLSSSSTNTQYPSAKTVYDNFVTRDEEIEKLQTENAQLLADHPDILDENDEFPSGTDLALEGTGDLPMEVDVGGNSTQIQYEGYNELEGDTSYSNTNVDTKTSVSLQLWLSNTTLGSQDQTIGGETISNKGRYYYTFTPNSDKVGMVIKHSGSQIDLRKTFSIELQSGTTYTVSLDITGVNPTVQGGFSFKDVMVYKGSTEKPYEPFVGNQASPNPPYPQAINNVEGDVEVKAENKNLLNLSTLVQGYYNNDTNRTLTGTSDDRYRTFKKFLTAGTYTIICSSAMYSVRTFPDYDSSINNYWNFFNSSSKTITITEDTTIYWGIRKSDGTNWDDNVDKLWLVKGSTATPYVPHAENTVTFPLSQGQKFMLGDTLEDDGVHHKRKQVVFDGSNDENWQVYVSYNRFSIIIANILRSSSDSVISSVLCNKLIAVRKDKQDEYNNSISIASNSNDIIIRIDTSITTVAELRTWLQQNSITVEYDLADSALEDNIEPYTPEQQVAYNKLKEMQSYYDLTYVSGSSDNAQPILTAHAKKSLKVMNDEIAELQQAIINS